MLSASCPHCSATIKILDRHVGRVVRCPKCRAKFRVSHPQEHDSDSSSLPNTPTFYEAEESRVSPRAIVFASSIVLFVIALGVVLITAGKNAATRQQQAAETQSRKVTSTQPARPAPTREDSIIARESDDAVRLLGLGWLFFLVLWLVIWQILAIALMIWVVKDSRNRGDDNGVLWMIVIFFTGIVGLIIYLAARRTGSLITCENCQNRKLMYAVACPHCGVKAALSTPSA